MTIVAIADNDYLIGLKPGLKADVLLALGDLGDHAILKAIDCFHPDAVYAVRGNHDELVPFPKGIVDLHLTVKTYQGLKFGGFAGSWRYKPEGHYLYTQENVEESMQAFPYVDVFIAHASPAGIHEYDNRVHQGFSAFSAYISRAKPRYFIHGHQHIDATTVLAETTVIGVYGEKIIEIRD